MPSANHHHPRLLITAGPTHEPIDAVRYIGNRSSGRLGMALAHESVRRGWPTTLLLGPTGSDTASFPQESLHRFRTAAELEALLHDTWPDHDVLIMAAAIADFTPAKPQPAGKLRRDGAAMSLELVPTPDLLANLATQTREDQLVIGFALEPADELDASATRKLAAKRADAIVANPIDTLDSETIHATVYLRDGTKRSPGAMSKIGFAAWLLDALAELRADALRSRAGGKSVPRR